MVRTSYQSLDYPLHLDAVIEGIIRGPGLGIISALSIRRLIG